jgi:hypothetical protein
MLMMIVSYIFLSPVYSQRIEQAAVRTWPPLAETFLAFFAYEGDGKRI